MSPLLRFPSKSLSPYSQSVNYDNSIDCDKVGLWYRFGETGQGLAFFGFAVLAVSLLFVCAILAGLTLALFTLDITRLHVLSLAGDQRTRDQALALSRIKRHSSWFLCSMIICSVACAESIPIIVELLFGNGWLPIVVSTIAIAIFAELLPQYLIPRRAIIWGYYCWGLIWGLMWLTCIISWPLSCLLDKLYGPQANEGIYTPEQMDVLIKFHERAEKHGGILGPDASRVMRGALGLDCQALRDDFQQSLRQGKITMANLEESEAVRADIIVPWSSVRCININEEVTKALILRIKNWAYSRVPVVGDIEEGDYDSAGFCGVWNNQKVYGFLHIKNLVGLEVADKDPHSKKLLVKDLKLYPLPIVRDDMPLYDLLNVFQLGMARIAVVIPTPSHDRLVPLGASVGNLDALPRHVAPLWSVLTGLDARNMIEMNALAAHIDWTTDYLDAVQNDMEPLQKRKHNIIGIGCPQPLGIVTYEDIVDAILLKTSLDEKDFYDKDHVVPLTKCGKEGDFNSVSSNHSFLRVKKPIPHYATKLHAAFEQSGSSSDRNAGMLRRRAVSGPGTWKNEDRPDIIRRRNMSGPDDGVDGPSEHRGQDFDGANERLTSSRVDTCIDCGSHTVNAFGGFHFPSDNAELFRDFSLLLKNDTVGSTILPASSTFLPHVIDASEAEHCTENRPYASSSNSCASNSLPILRRVTPFSKEASTSCESLQAVKIRASRTVIRPLEGVSVNGLLDEHDDKSRSTKTFHNRHEDRAGMTLENSWNKTDLSHVKSDFNGIKSLGPVLSVNQDTLTTANYFPSTSIEQTRKTAAVVDASADCETPQKSRPRPLQESFHDDRALLPSQRAWSSRKSQSGFRRISLWF